MLGWLVHERGIEPQTPVFDKSARKGGTFARADFAHDHGADTDTCPGGKTLATTGTLVNDEATGPFGARDEFHLAATAQSLRKLAKLIPMPQAAAAA